MLGVLAGERADAVRAEELVLVEHAGEDAAELVFIDDGQEAAAIEALLLSGWMLAVSSGRLAVNAANAIQTSGRVLKTPSSKTVDAVEWKQADHGTDLETLGIADGRDEHIVEKPSASSQRSSLISGAVHRAGDPQKMLQVTGARILEVRVFLGEFECDMEHAVAEKGHPGGAVGLVEMAAGGKRGAAVEDADVIQAQEAPVEDVAPPGVLAVDPPVEVEQQLNVNVFRKVGLLRSH